MTSTDVDLMFAPTSPNTIAGRTTLEQLLADLIGPLSICGPGKDLPVLPSLRQEHDAIPLHPHLFGSWWAN